MKKAFSLIIAVFIMLVCSSCGNDPARKKPVPIADVPIIVKEDLTDPTGNGQPDMTGRIIRINNLGADTDISIIVENENIQSGAPSEMQDMPEKKIYTAVQIRVDDTTFLVNDKGDKIAPSQLAAGSVVELWFDDPPAEDSAAIPYVGGLGVKVLTENSDKKAFDVINIIQMVATLGNSSLAVIEGVIWDGREESVSLYEILLNNAAANLTANPGETVSLKFIGISPDNIFVSYSADIGGDFIPLEADAENYRFAVPPVEFSPIYVRVQAQFGEGESANYVKYAFSVTVKNVGM